MYNTSNVGPHGINGGVHRYFARALTASADLVTGHIADDQIVGFHHAFADGGRGTQDAIVIQPDTDIAVIGRNPAFLIHQAAGAYDVVAKFLLGLRHQNLRFYQADRSFPRDTVKWHMSEGEQKKVAVTIRGSG